MIAILLLALAAPQDARALLAEAAPGARFALLVVDEDGREVAAIDPDARVIPASNAKLLTTAAAADRLTAPDTSGIAVHLDGPDAILIGHGDARASSAPDCQTDCLATLADAVAARTRRVRDVVGDDTAFPDERWPQGMSWNNMATRSGTAVSALTLDDNETVVTVTPGRGASGDGYYAIDDRTRTAPGPTSITADRAPGSTTIRVEGSIAPDAPPETLRLAVEDPAHRAAWRFAALLRDRGVAVTGRIVARHRPLDASDDPARRGAAPPPRPPGAPVLARLTPAALAEDIAHMLRVSQNLHAELLLRRLGAQSGTGSVADGIAAVAKTMDRAGVAPKSWTLSDGSGMSTYDRVTPRAVVTLLRWAARQPWGAAWSAGLPIGGKDGTLARRFRGTPLEGRIHAKTGSLNATAALAGTLTTAAGHHLTFAAYANDVAEGVSATRALDAALLVVAARN